MYQRNNDNKIFNAAVYMLLNQSNNEVKNEPKESPSSVESNAQPVKSDTNASFVSSSTHMSETNASNFITSPPNTYTRSPTAVDNSAVSANAYARSSGSNSSTSPNAYGRSPSTAANSVTPSVDSQYMYTQSWTSNQGYYAQSSIYQQEPVGYQYDTTYYTTPSYDNSNRMQPLTNAMPNVYETHVVPATEYYVMQPYKIVPMAVNSVEVIQAVPQVNYNGAQLQSANYHPSQYNQYQQVQQNLSGVDLNRPSISTSRNDVSESDLDDSRKSPQKSRNFDSTNNSSIAHAVPVNSRKLKEPVMSNQNKKATHRVTKNQPGTIKYTLVQQIGKREIPLKNMNNTVRPSSLINVTWQLPSKIYYDQENVDLVVGLVRYGSPSNTPCIVTKHLQAFGKDLNLINTIDMFGNNIVEGKLQFHAPKAGGFFIFRMFEQRERSLITLATSVKFFVELLDTDVTVNLNICSDFFTTSSYVRAISQLQTIGTAMKNYGKMPNGENAKSMLRHCTDETLKVLQDVMHTNPRDDSELGKNRIHVEIHDAFCALKSNIFAWTLLSDDQKIAINKSERLFSPFMNRFFNSEEEILSALVEVFDFIREKETELFMKASYSPTKASDLEVDSVRLIALDQVLVQLIQEQHCQIDDIYPKKENTRKQLENILRESPYFPKNSELTIERDPILMMDESDLELILNVSAGPDINADDRVPLLRRLGDIFSSFEGVNVRIVNRIAYLQLTDHLSNLTCNVSLKNPITDLSIKLIKSYIEIDDRVASMINFLKVWTKVRAIKTSSQGYLSEFGYILCLIHYLQCRPLPILPSLQKLSKDWNGENFADSNSIGQDFVINPLDNSVVDCYFYAIHDEDHLEKLKKVASRNTESVLSLLYCFFKFFSLEFDYRLSVVSVRHAKNILKVDKAEVDGWPQNDRLSIEDPLEPSYDVAFNMKAPQFIHFRKEMLRAYQIIKKGEKDLYEMLLLPARK